VKELFLVPHLRSQICTSYLVGNLSWSRRSTSIMYLQRLPLLPRCQFFVFIIISTVNTTLLIYIRCHLPGWTSRQYGVRLGPRSLGSKCVFFAVLLIHNISSCQHNDPENPFNFPMWRKIMICAIVCVLNIYWHFLHSGSS